MLVALLIMLLLRKLNLRERHSPKEVARATGPRASLWTLAQVLSIYFPYCSLEKSDIPFVT